MYVMSSIYDTSISVGLPVAKIDNVYLKIPHTIKLFSDLKNF